MDRIELKTLLAGLGLGGIRYYPSTGSTNDEAARWAEEGAKDASLVVADTQTAGRGRSGRFWHSPAGASLSFSLIFYPSEEEKKSLQFYTALGALSVCETFKCDFGLEAKIKWPNDVLVDGQKVCGALAEARWTGNNLAYLILGVGINVARESTDPESLPSAALHFPATSMEEVLDYRVNRLALLHSVLAQLLQWRKRIASSDFLKAWETKLAFRNERIRIIPYGDDEQGRLNEPVIEGVIIGLAPDGSLRLFNKAGDIIEVSIGEVHLRPIV